MTDRPMLPVAVDLWPEEARALYDERAAIMEHHGGVDPWTAEELAEQIVREVWRRQGADDA